MRRTRPIYPVGAIANYMIGRAHSEKVPITHLELQKLVYFVHGVHLAATGQPMFLEDVEAWPYGPVIPELYHEFKRFGRRQIRRWSRNFDYENNEFVYPEIPPEDKTALRMAEYVWKKYGRMKPSALVQLTHQKGTPWSQTVKKIAQAETPVPGIKVIENETIRSHFFQLLIAAAPASQGTS